MSLYPAASPALLAFVRMAYAALQLLTLVAALPQAARYFRTERWGGYTQSTRWTNAFQNPIASAALMTAWFAAVLCLLTGVFVVPAAAVNLALCHYLFIRMRWRGVLRGMGAPGFIAYWLAAAVFLLELTSRHAPQVRGLALLTLQIDFALIMLSAGLYKLLAGYRSGYGMELGMANPEWGYWWTRWKQWPPSHPLFRFLDEMAWGTEVAAGLLMLVPQTRWLGALAILLSFVFIATQIRLGWLCEMVIVCTLVFVPAGSAVDRMLSAWMPTSQLASAGVALPAALTALLAAALWVYIALLPFARAGMFYNQLAHRALPAPLQRALDAFANAFGLILWRVFSADVTNFFVRIWSEDDDGRRTLVSDYDGFPGFRRFRQVGECIAITSIFTTRRYYPSNRPLFTDRLLRYARTIPRPAGSILVFEWVDVVPRADRFDHIPVAEYRVDVTAATIEDVALADRGSVTDPPAASPMHEGARPGSYAPLHQ
jgi:hypothetical protein